ncbi:hypothetical protein M441DRAFT_70208 [Trichoderma asperellum CBS 433.97]|uniref:PNPLA domain-containing protein n=1 Tax=Trichoderma asperellum (strain ATCC 204424 / CBS 433.97 / NBRC 101777) TaxID=1042311 RepID=A0A2T3Z6H6_TRIA4|nr:hypothetical protein M441DRAFT_70208 [Trichoderma asperellum CBS 433.97]PTB40407.1 hypothetical protein M441DRAFT_70208 [Trichoderma asperellum CBS 433.97]
MTSINNCNHTRWLRLWRKGKHIMLEASDRPRRLLKDFRNVDEPAGVVVLLGNQTKSIANFKPGNSQLDRKKSNGEYHLYASYLHDARPMIICDGDMPGHNRLPRSCKLQSCHQVEDRIFMEETDSAKTVEASDNIYHRLISPFSDVICIFVEDVGGIDSTLRRLNAWSRCSQLSSTLFVRPALILVTSRGQKTQIENAVNAASLNDYFQRIRIVTVCRRTRKLRSRNVKMKPKQCLALRREILRSLDIIQQSRLMAGMLFCVRHTVEFLYTASEIVTRSSCEPFDYINRSRDNNPIATDFVKHLTTFLCYFDDENMKQLALPHIASSIILDQYPPGMHHFKPLDVFNTLYREGCAQASENLKIYRQESGRPVPNLDISSLIKAEMHSKFSKFEELGSSKELHLYNLAQFYENGIFPSCGESCFSCLQRKPMYSLPCGHWVCQICVKIFYSPNTGDPWLFYVNKCILCGVDTAGLRIRVKPDTATTRVLSIDGGGARGCIPLEFLQALQTSIGLPYPVQRNFDVVYGTSSGAMSTCALYFNGWPIEKCIKYFEQSSREAFKKRRLSQVLIHLFGYIPILSPTFRFIVSLLVDSKYSAQNLEIIQQEVYGTNCSIVNSREASEMGISMGVTLTSTDDTSTFIVTNYGVAGENREKSGYYFTPHHLDGIGTFQDGGLTFNNPVSIALKEAAALFPATPEPSIVASFGTGSNRTSYRGPLTWCKGLYLARLARAVRKHLDSDNAWAQLMSNRKPGDRGEFFRFDVEFQSQLPALDDVNSMVKAARIARKVARSSAAMKQLGKCHRAELFFFELDSSRPPHFVSGVYECVGYILCRLRAGTAEFETFMRQLHDHSASFRFRFQEGMLPRAIQGLSETDPTGNFRQEIVFSLPTKQHHFEISLEEGSPASICHISGSPFSLDSLIKQQNMDAKFGTKDHQQPVTIKN